MRVERKPVVSAACAESCAMARICHNVDPVQAVTLAMGLAKRPYGGCHSDKGPTLDPEQERCHLDPDVQLALNALATGMQLQAGESITTDGPIDEATGRLSMLEVSQSRDEVIPTMALQSPGYIR